MNQIINYAPDLDPVSPGILTDCTNFIPSLKGYRGGYAPQGVGLAALANTCYGSEILKKLDASTRLFAGTATKLYEAGATTWTDVSRATAYNASNDSRWRFAQFGNVSLAVNKSDVLQASSSGAFADLTAPKASIVETVGQFVFLFDTNEGTYGDSLDRWWCSAIGDHTDWVPSISTQCVTGRLISGQGKIRASRAFGESIVVYKSNSIYVGSYVGTPEVWQFTQIPGDAGALCQEVVINIGTSEVPIHLFMGTDNFYLFDGSHTRPVGNPLRQTVFNELNSQYKSYSTALHDRINGLVYFFYPSIQYSTGAIDKCVVYNYKTDKWGRADRTIEATANFITASSTWDTLAALYSTWDSYPSVTWDMLATSPSTIYPAIIDTTHTLKTLNGASSSSSMTTSNYGDDKFYYNLARVKPRFIVNPTSATMTNYYKYNAGDSWSTDTTRTMSNNRFDLNRSARWHKITINFTGDVELPESSFDYTKEGEE